MPTYKPAIVDDGWKVLQADILASFLPKVP
jgi:hypothetical protein